MFILIRWMRPSKNRGRPHHLSRSCFMDCKRGAKLSLKKSFKHGEIFIPRYEKPAGDQRNGCEIFGSNIGDLQSAMASILEKLILYLEKEPQSLISFINLGIHYLGESKQIKTSSAYNKILCRQLFKEIPFMLTFCLMIAAKGSIARANNNGLRRQPCLVPRSILNYQT